MSLALEIIKNIHGYSRAKYSTWFYYRPDRILFDVGEGVSVAMRNLLYGVDLVLISHSHGDHIGGIPGLLRSRASSMGDITKPLRIYYPRNDRNMQKLRSYIDDSLGNLPFQITWGELSPGDSLALSANRSLEAFASQHMENGMSLGYRIVEKRARLKKEYRQLPQGQIVTKIREIGKDNMTENYSQILLAYTGDAMTVAPDDIAQAEVLLHDATFLDKSDREENTHATVEEACLAAKNAGVSCLALFHFSCRYRYPQIKEKIHDVIHRHNIDFPVYYMFPPSHPMEFRQINVP